MTATAPRPLSSDETDAVSGGFGIAFKLPLALPVMSTDLGKRKGEVKDSHDRYANTETPIATR